MEKTYTVKGMMCPHCEAHTKKAIEAIEGVTEAIADHKKECVTVKMTQQVSDEAIKKAVEGAGYTFVARK